MSETLLKVDNLGITFGGLKAVQKVNMYLNRGELVGLIGPNGAGKTTMFNMLTGVYAPTEGSVVFGGKSIAGLDPYKVTRQGISRTFQNIRLFKELSVTMFPASLVYCTLRLFEYFIKISILSLSNHAASFANLSPNFSSKVLIESPV